MDNALERLFRQGLEQTRAAGRDYVRQTDEAVRRFRATRERIHQKLGDDAVPPVGIETRRLERTYDPKAGTTRVAPAPASRLPGENVPKGDLPSGDVPEGDVPSGDRGNDLRASEVRGEDDGAEGEPSDGDQTGGDLPDDGGATQDLLNIPDFLRRT